VVGAGLKQLGLLRERARWVISVFPQKRTGSVRHSSKPEHTLSLYW
jgi:hypothetical protein